MVADYVSGYSESSASFTYSRTNGKVNIYFAIKFAWLDKELAEKVREYFGVGKIYVVKNKEGMVKSYYYRVNKIDELANVVNHFDHCPLVGEKKERYLKWREMYLVRRGIIEGVSIENLAEDLSLLNPKNK